MVRISDHWTLDGLVKDVVAVDKGVVLLHDRQVLLVVGEHQVAAATQGHPAEADRLFVFLLRFSELLIGQKKVITY